MHFREAYILHVHVRICTQMDNLVHMHNAVHAHAHHDSCERVYYTQLCISI